MFWADYTLRPPQASFFQIQCLRSGIFGLTRRRYRVCWTPPGFRPHFELTPSRSMLSLKTVGKSVVTASRSKNSGRESAAWQRSFGIGRLPGDNLSSGRTVSYGKANGRFKQTNISLQRTCGHERFVGRRLHSLRGRSYSYEKG